MKIVSLHTKEAVPLFNPLFVEYFHIINHNAMTNQFHCLPLPNPGLNEDDTNKQPGQGQSPSSSTQAHSHRRLEGQVLQHPGCHLRQLHHGQLVLDGDQPPLALLLVLVDPIVYTLLLQDH